MTCDQEWVDELAAYVKSVDPNHLVTVGMAGWYGASTPNRSGPSLPPCPRHACASSAGQGTLTRTISTSETKLFCCVTALRLPP